MTDNDAARLFQHLQAGDSAEAASLAHDMLRAGQQTHLADFALGILAYQTRDYDSAVAHLKQSIAIEPTLAAWNNLGAAFRATGRLAEASAAYQNALAVDPKFVDAAANYANVLMDLGNFAAAESMALGAIANGANSVEVYVTLGNAQFRQGRLVEAAASYRTSLARGENQTAIRNLGSTLANLGRFTEAKQVYSSALAKRPDADLHSSFLICQTYDPQMAAADLREASAVYERAYALHLRPTATAHANTPDPGRRLRIGYVSPDLCNHVVAVFMLPVMTRHDSSAFDIYCYADVRNTDDTSRKFQALSTWRQTVGMADERLAALIAADGIDILIDLAGHSPGNRQLVFARKPAPVQLSYVIGTGTTTGLTAIDGLIADGYLLPPGSEHVISEAPCDLGRPFVAYEPPATMPPVGPLPALRNGYLTFGYFGRPIRLNDRVVKVWSALLAACPGSRLRLDNKPFGAAATQDDVRKRFAEFGVAPDRLDLGDTPTHPAVLAAYNEIDIALDPFPHNAGTTSLEALWMGAPVLTLADRPPVGRLGESLLNAVGLGDWVAHDEAGYIAKGVDANANIEALAALRAGLRARCEQSQLSDVADLTRAMERLYRTAWQRWCATRRAA
ncbi:O-linked N-acetylglucosamine transferase family protein [Hyphomicrobium sp.]|uniref:O-linked N-acetylglucosamine transferase, SPINDLY family protein n=1 Tax=Hyphomicrobium sp. TaxID=82 RepID=UPI003F71222C